MLGATFNYCGNPKQRTVESVRLKEELGCVVAELPKARHWYASGAAHFQKCPVSPWSGSRSGLKLRKELKGAAVVRALSRTPIRCHNLPL